MFPLFAEYSPSCHRARPSRPGRSGWFRCRDVDDVTARVVIYEGFIAGIFEARSKLPAPCVTCPSSRITRESPSLKLMRALPQKALKGDPPALGLESKIMRGRSVVSYFADSGINPRSCMILSWSNSLHSSVILPFTIRQIVMPRPSILLPVAGRPLPSPVLVPVPS
jgi:hypothetical protein